MVKHVTDSVHFLRREQFVQNTSEGSLLASPLGKATTLSGIAPKDAIDILKPLMKARTEMILSGGLHAVFLVTPPSTSIEPDWTNYSKLLSYLFHEHPEAKLVAAHLGISEGLAHSFFFAAPTNPAIKQLYKRFYSAIILFRLIQESPLINVVNLMKSVTRGQIQLLQKDASTFCGMTVVFCEKLNWHTLAAILQDYSARLSFGVRKELIPLVRISTDITPFRARVFYNEEITSAKDLLRAGEDRVTDLLSSSLPFTHSNLSHFLETGKTLATDSNGVDREHKVEERKLFQALAKRILLK